MATTREAGFHRAKEDNTVASSLVRKGGNGGSTGAGKGTNGAHHKLVDLVLPTTVVSSYCMVVEVILIKPDKSWRNLFPLLTVLVVLGKL